MTSYSVRHGADTRSVSASICTGGMRCRCTSARTRNFAVVIAPPGGAMTTAKLRVLALVHRHLIPPVQIDADTDLVSAPWRTEYDVISTLTAVGHEVQTLGVNDDLGGLRR